MNPNLFPTYPPDSPFGVLQQHAQIQQQQQQMAGAAAADLSVNSNSASRHSHPLVSVLTKRRKFDNFDDALDRECNQPKSKRLRTNILPAREVGLKERVLKCGLRTREYVYTRNNSGLMLR
jgi:AT-binding transcription factor 1